MTLALTVAAGILLVGAGWTRAAGAALREVPRADALRDHSDGVKGAGAVADLLDERDKVSLAVGVVASALLVISAVLATSAFAVGGSQTEVLVWGLAAAAVFVVVGDIVPRGVGRALPTRIAYRSSRLLTVVARVGVFATSAFPEPDFSSSMDTAEANDGADEHERELIDSVLEFSETIVREVMTPRPDMTTVAVTASIEELIEVATEAGFSRVPVTSNGDVVGHVIVKDLLSVFAEESRPSTVAEVMRPIDFVPETKLASTLLAEMQENHTHQVIVVDEYGDIAGLVTIEDLLEELVGEIADETDYEESLIESTSDGWDVDARLAVDDLIKHTGVELPDDEWDTVGGLVLGLAERVPEEGEEFEFQNLILKVKKMQGRRVSEVSVTSGRGEAV